MLQPFSITVMDNCHKTTTSSHTKTGNNNDMFKNIYWQVYEETLFFLHFVLKKDEFLPSCKYLSLEFNMQLVNNLHMQICVWNVYGYHQIAIHFFKSYSICVFPRKFNLKGNLIMCVVLSVNVKLHLLSR